MFGDVGGGRPIRGVGGGDVGAEGGRGGEGAREEARGGETEGGGETETKESHDLLRGRTNGLEICWFCDNNKHKPTKKKEKRKIDD